LALLRTFYHGGIETQRKAKDWKKPLVQMFLLFSGFSVSPGKKSSYPEAIIS
jgi:hypothetical protein